MTAYLICALFVTAGLFILMDVRPRDVTDELKKPFEREVNRKKRIRFITGKKPSAVQRMMEEAVTMLDASGMGEQFSTYRNMAILMAVAGFLFGMVIHYLTGNTEPTPYSLFKWAYDNGYYSGSGLGHEAVSALGKLCGVEGKWIGKNGSKIVEALKSGHPVIAHMGPGIFTRQGHYIVLKGVTDDGKILVNDPNSKSRTGKAYPLSTILNQSKTSSPFMICSPAN